MHKRAYHQWLVANNRQHYAITQQKTGGQKCHNNIVNCEIHSGRQKNAPCLERPFLELRGDRCSMLRPHSHVALCAGSHGRGQSTDRLQDSIDLTGTRLYNRVVCAENATSICHDPPSYILYYYRYSTRYQIRSSSRDYANRYYYTYFQVLFILQSTYSCIYIYMMMAAVLL